MLGIVAVLLALIVVTNPAHASVGVSCRAEDASAKFGVDAAFTRGLGGGLVNFGAILQILLPAIPPDLRSVQFDRSEVSGVWFYNRDIKLQIHHERQPEGPSGSVDLVVETTESRNDESLYRGRYVLRINYAETKEDIKEKSLELRGRVACSVE
jgi:hypothetical protein